MVGLLQGCVDRGRGVGHGDQVLRRRVGHHFLPVIIELGSRTISGHDHSQLVRSLESNFGLGGESERMTVAAWALVEMHRREFHCAGSSQTAARGFQNVNGFWLERGRGLRHGTGFGRGRFGLLLSFPPVSLRRWAFPERPLTPVTTPTTTRNSQPY